MRQPDDATVKQVRGSALLLTGRAISRFVNGAAQILLARALTKGDYGAFAYGLAVASFSEIFATLGLTRVITRFVPVYEERGELGKAVGTIVFVFGTIVSLGLTTVVLVNALSGSIDHLLVHDRRTIELLAILIALTPIEALNHTTDGVLAVMGRPGAIFFRKHVFSPVLRVGVVAILISRGADVTALAVGYVGVGVVGLLAYAWALVRSVRELGLPFADWRKIQIPFRELGAFALPLLGTGLVGVLLEASDVFILGKLSGTAAVADIRAVRPLARFVQTFLLSFTLLFTTLTARLYARGDRKELNDLYWRTACWITLLSFPIFAVTFVFSAPLTTTLYGSRYAASAPILAVLALGYFVNGSLGLNAQVLSVFRYLRYLVVVNVVVLVAAVTSMVLLAPGYGALGAAYAKAGALILTNLLLQAGLRHTGVKLFDARFSTVYLAIAVAIFGLWVFNSVVAPPLFVGVVVTGAVSIVLLIATRGSLQIGAVFPEIRRIPLARYLASEPDED